MTQEAKVLVGIGIFTVIVLAIATFFFVKSSPQTDISGNAPANSQYLMRPTSHQTASQSANIKVTVVEFGDYQCPACEAAYPITKQMLAQYSGRINFVFRNFPLPQHANAPMAAEAAEAAGAQGKFWQMHDKLYDTQNDWADSQNPLPLFTAYAKDLGLNVSEFQSDVTGNKDAGVIQSDQNDGNFLGVNETPTFFVNGQKIAGVPTLSQLQNAIDPLLK